jgi:hypothetical protein
MPLWHYIDGCPFPQQCGKNKTTAFPKSMKFAGLSMDLAVEKCVYHLMSSSLHSMSKVDATRAAREMEFHTYEEPTDDEAEDADDTLSLDVRPQSPPRGRVTRHGHGVGPRTKRARKELDHDEGAPDPLVKGISDQVSALVAKNLSASSSSSSDSAARREAKKCIADAEDAARKAPAIAMSAAQAFGDVAKKLNRAWHSMGSLRRCALISSGNVTAIATCHYFRIFMSWAEAFDVVSKDGGDYTVTRTPFNDAYRYVD